MSDLAGSVGGVDETDRQRVLAEEWTVQLLVTRAADPTMVAVQRALVDHRLRLLVAGLPVELRLLR